jgi:hypothetical protein
VHWLVNLLQMLKDDPFGLVAMILALGLIYGVSQIILSYVK